MSDELTRIGRGVPGAGKKPYRKMPALILAAALMLAALVMLTVALIVNQPGSQQAAPQSPATTAATVDARGACIVLVPVLTTSTDLVMAVVDKPDGSTVDWAKLDRTIADLQAVRPISPVELRDDIQSQIDPLVELQQRHNGTWAGTGTLDLSDYRASGLRIGAWCGQYVG